MKKILALILTAAMALTLTACDKPGNSSDLGESSSSSGETNNSSDAESGSGNSLAAVPEWEYVTLVRDNYKKYFIASNSPENGLPDVPNNLEIRSLKTAIEEDPEMKPLVEKFIAEPSISERIKMTDEILNVLCETDKITKDNEFFSMKKLAILEKFWGTGDEFPEPTSDVTAPLLEESYKYLTERYCMAIIGSQYLQYIESIGIKKGDDEKYYPDMEDFLKNVFEDHASGKLNERQISDIALYLAYYGVMRDKKLDMLDQFQRYARDNHPEALPAVAVGRKEAAELFSGINDVQIVRLPADEPASSGRDANSSNDSSQT